MSNMQGNKPINYFNRGPYVTDQEAVYVLERKPIDENTSHYSIWVKHDGIALTPVQLSQLLADTMQNVIKKVA